jgi:hypothetical protein
VLYVAGNQNNQPGMRSVGDNEAEQVIGGGQTGFSTTGTDFCGPSTSGCNGATITFCGSQVQNGYTGANFQSCGGNCGVTATSYIRVGE